MVTVRQVSVVVSEVAFSLSDLHKSTQKLSLALERIFTAISAAEGTLGRGARRPPTWSWMNVIESLTLKV